MSVPQVRALYALRDPLSMRELAERLFLDPSNLTALVDRLEELGLVERTADTEDRRIKRLVITERGRAPGRRGDRRRVRAEPGLRRTRRRRATRPARSPHPGRQHARAVVRGRGSRVVRRRHDHPPGRRSTILSNAAGGDAMGGTGRGSTPCSLQDGLEGLRSVAPRAWVAHHHLEQDRSGVAGPQRAEGRTEGQLDVRSRGQRVSPTHSSPSSTNTTCGEWWPWRRTIIPGSYRA